MRLPWKLPLAIALTAVLWLAPAARPGEPVGGASSTICDPVCADPAVTVICKRTAFPWGGECRSKGEGAAFRSWLVGHGGPQLPWRFRERHPELARIFSDHWPDPDWQALNRVAPAAFKRSLRLAAATFNVSYDWLYACALSEGVRPSGLVAGIHYEDPVPDDAYWFQYLSGTFTRMSGAAWPALRALGYRPPESMRRRDSQVGQTWTTAWAFANGRSHEWFGRGC